jgi:hypothetical protein
MNGATSPVVTLARVLNVEVTDDTLSVDLEDGRSVSVPIGRYPRLANGSPAERANLEISGAGYGVHWPDLDEDIGIEGLLLGKHSSESASSFERWLQRRREKLPQDQA